MAMRARAQRPRLVRELPRGGHSNVIGNGNSPWLLVAVLLGVTLFVFMMGYVRVRLNQQHLKPRHILAEDSILKVPPAAGAEDTLSVSGEDAGIDVALKGDDTGQVEKTGDGIEQSDGMEKSGVATETGPDVATEQSEGGSLSESAGSGDRASSEESSNTDPGVEVETIPEAEAGEAKTVEGEGSEAGVAQEASNETEMDVAISAEQGEKQEGGQADDQQAETLDAKVSDASTEKDIDGKDEPSNQGE